MSEIPSSDQEPIVKNRLLYMGTTPFKNYEQDFDEKDITLVHLQETISQRYPIDGSNFSKGIDTTLSIFPSGIQMEHSSSKSETSTSATIFFPIKSLVYAGALKFGMIHNNDPRSGKFMPLDSQVADSKHNAKYPPLFVVLVKASDQKSNNEIIESHVFVVSSKKTSKLFLKGCKKAFEVDNPSISEFLEEHGSIPLVYDNESTPANKINGNMRKVFDQSGYYYALRNSPIELWQLFESPDNNMSVKLYDKNNSEPVQWLTNRNDLVDSTKKTDFESNIKDMLDKDELLEENFLTDGPKVLVRQRPDPPPVIIEKYIRKKQPQVIIKEIYVIEPALPPIKYVQKLEGEFIMPKNYLMF